MHALIGVSPLGFLAASLLVILSPGPDMALVARNTIALGRGAGLRTAGGALIGVSVHVLAAVAGLSAVLTSSSAAFSALKLAGAGYLAFLGLRAILSARGGEEDDLLRAPAPASFRAPASPVAQDILSASLNPKLAVFFLTFLPQFVDPDDMPELSMLAHGAAFVAMGSAWLTLWVIGMDRIASWLRRSAVRARLERLTGAVLVGMGVRLALSER